MKKRLSDVAFSLHCNSSVFFPLLYSSFHLTILIYVHRSKAHGRNYAVRIMKLESRDKVSKSENEKLHTSLEAKGNERKKKAV